MPPLRVGPFAFAGELADHLGDGQAWLPVLVELKGRVQVRALDTAKIRPGLFQRLAKADAFLAEEPSHSPIIALVNMGTASKNAFRALTCR